MPNTPPTAALGDVETDSAHLDEDVADGAPDGSLDELSQRVADLERELAEAAAEEAGVAQRLEAQRMRRASLAEKLRNVHEQAIAELVEEAMRQRSAILTEAEAFRETSRKDAEREANSIIREASAEAKKIRTEAEQEGAALLDGRLQELAALEAEATRRVEVLETDHEMLTYQVKVAKKIYEELQNTLRLVAKTSIKELAEARASLARLDPWPPSTPRRRASDSQPFSPAEPNS